MSTPGFTNISSAPSKTSSSICTSSPLTTSEERREMQRRVGWGSLAERRERQGAKSGIKETIGPTWTATPRKERGTAAATEPPRLRSGWGGRGDIGRVRLRVRVRLWLGLPVRSRSRSRIGFRVGVK